MTTFATTERDASGRIRLMMTCPRLRWKECLVLLVGTIACWFIAPRVAMRWGAKEFEQDERVAYEQSEDYWRYRQVAMECAEHADILFVGDSVVWGEYVDERDSWSACLNHEQLARRFVNGGVNGLHPLAMRGLLRHYVPTPQESGLGVMLHCNLLWLTSAARDLRDDQAQSFNHPRLIPQFRFALTSYQASAEERLSVSVEQRVLMRQWVRHLWWTYFEGQDVPRWSLEHPYEWPDGRVVREAARTTRQSAAAWTERGIPLQDYHWVELDESEQWRALRETIQELQHRGIPVFVCVGPFNRHLLSTSSEATWSALRRGVSEWLQEQDVPHWTAPVLDSQLYADASHPLAEGYRVLARQLSEDSQFRAWLNSRSPRHESGAARP